MSKPTVFFSHSSKDSEPLARLKEKFAVATGGSVDVFLSSDGQSIPLGRNWVHRIEEELKSASLMFVFVTANALRSNWILFESGFAYARGTRVIPVGFLGTDLAHLSPPLSLLQGFNIRSEEGLNNIVAVVNEVFAHSHRSIFTKQDYEEVAGASVQAEDGPFGDSGRYIREVLVVSVRETPRPSQGWNESQRKAEAQRELSAALDDAGVSHQDSANSSEIVGAKIDVDCNYSQIVWRMRIDPSTALQNLPIAERLSKALRGPEAQGMYLTCMFSSNIFCETRFHAVSGKMGGIATLMPNRFLGIGEIHFRVERQTLLSPRGGFDRGAVALTVGAPSRIPSTDQIRSLVSTLFEKGILHFDPELEND